MLHLNKKMQFVRREYQMRREAAAAIKRRVEADLGRGGAGNSPDNADRQARTYFYYIMCFYATLDDLPIPTAT